MMSVGIGQEKKDKMMIKKSKRPGKCWQGSKTGQMITSEIFVYILALIVTSLILLYGYNAISKMRQQTNTVSGIQLKTDLVNSIESLGYEFGSVEIKKFNVPNGVNEVCFVDIDNADPDSTVFDSYPIIKDSVKGGSKNNVFLLGTSSIVPIEVGRITVENNFKCIGVVGGKVQITMKATGKAVDIS